MCEMCEICEIFEICEMCEMCEISECVKFLISSEIRGCTCSFGKKNKTCV